MGVTRSAEARLPPAAERQVIWHDLECGGYDADLTLWRELAGGSHDGSSADPILEIGAGSGRVALDLAHAGHRVTALDLDRRLLDALSARAAGAKVEVVCADARTFDIGRRDFGLCLVPMQTVQLLGGEAGRAAFLDRVRAHLRPGGVLACAIVSDFESFDCTRDGDGPPPDVMRLGAVDYMSRPIRVSADQNRVVIERVRRILPEGREPPRKGSNPLPSRSARSPTSAGELDVIELDLISVSQLEREGVAAGLRPGTARRVEATDEYLGSDVVLLHA
jgi:SAM-dependent methyltransferase